jgi:hypothetical protein
VPVRGIAAAVDDIALLGQCGLLGDVVVIAMQIGDILGNDHPFDVLPWTFADAVARVDRRLAVGRLSAEIGVPSVAAGSRGLRQLLANSIRPRQAAEVGALAGAGTGHKEGHVGSRLPRANGACADY